MPHGGGHADRAGGQRRAEVAAGRDAAAAGGVVGHWAAGQLAQPDQGVGDPVDRAERGRAGVQGRGQEGGQQAGGHLMPGIAEQRRQPYLGDTASQPPLTRAAGWLLLGGCGQLRA